MNLWGFQCTFCKHNFYWEPSRCLSLTTSSPQILKRPGHPKARKTLNTLSICLTTSMLLQASKQKEISEPYLRPHSLAPPLPCPCTDQTPVITLTPKPIATSPGNGTSFSQISFLHHVLGLGTPGFRHGRVQSSGALNPKPGAPKP